MLVRHLYFVRGTCIQHEQIFFTTAIGLQHDVDDDVRVLKAIIVVGLLFQGCMAAFLNLNLIVIEKISIILFIY